MPSTYTPIATTTLSSAQSTVTFSSISATYTDLYVVCQIQNTTNAALIFLRFNGDSSNNYSVTRIWGDGTNAVSDRFTNQAGIDCAYPSTSGWLITNFSIMNYANSTTNKTVLGRWNSAGNSNYTLAFVGLWRSTAAINQVILTPNGVNFAAGSTFTLYGIKAA